MKSPNPVLPLMLLCLFAATAAADVGPTAGQDEALAPENPDQAPDWSFPGEPGNPPHNDDWGGPRPGETNWGWGQHPEGPDDDVGPTLLGPIFVIV